MTETKLKEKIQEFAKQNYPGVLRKNHGSAFSGSGWPDLEYHWNGCTAFVELKAPGGKKSPYKKMTDVQKKRFKELTDVGMTCYCVDNLEDFRGVIEEWVYTNFVKG